MNRSFAHENFMTPLSSFTKNSWKSTGCLDTLVDTSLLPSPLLGCSLDNLPCKDSSYPHFLNGLETHDMMQCPKVPGQLRPTVMIHYMPHRTFQTPILCTCVPPVKLRRNINKSAKKRHSIGLTDARYTRHSTSRGEENKVKTSKSLVDISSTVRNRKQVSFCLPSSTYPELHRSTTRSYDTSYRVINISDMGEMTFASTTSEVNLTLAPSMVSQKEARTSLKKKLLKPLRLLKKKLKKKTSSRPAVEPRYRFSPIKTDFHTAFV